MIDGHDQSSRERKAAVSALQTEYNASFACEWALPDIKLHESRFLMVDEHQALFTRKYCRQPSWIDPSDPPPPDYCHEMDHGTEEDRAVFGSSSLEP